MTVGVLVHLGIRLTELKNAIGRNRLRLETNYGLGGSLVSPTTCISSSTLPSGQCPLSAAGAARRSDCWDAACLQQAQIEKKKFDAPLLVQSSKTVFRKILSKACNLKDSR